MKTLRNLTLAMLLLTLVAALPAMAEPGPGRGGSRGDGLHDGGFGPRLEKILDLTAEQKEAVTALREKHRGAVVENRKALMKLRNEIHGLMLEDAPDAGALEALVRKAGDLKTEMQVARTKQRLEVRKLLTAEQRDLLLLHGARHDKSGRGEGSRGGDHGRAGRQGAAQGCDGQGRSGDRPGRGN